jgi:hypothetical protein
MPRITLKASSFYSIRFRHSKTVDIDPEDWEDEVGRDAILDEEIDKYRNELIEITYTVEGE